MDVRVWHSCCCCCCCYCYCHDFHDCYLPLSLPMRFVRELVLISMLELLAFSECGCGRRDWSSTSESQSRGYTHRVLSNTLTTRMPVTASNYWSRHRCRYPPGGIVVSSSGSSGCSRRSRSRRRRNIRSSSCSNSSSKNTNKAMTATQIVPTPCFPKPSHVPGRKLRC